MDVLPLHPELVTMLQEWLEGHAPDEPLFPRLDRKKTWLMVKKDLERVDIEYETPEGIADFHAAGRFGQSAHVSHSSGSSEHALAHPDADLCRVVEAWSELPDHIQQTILTLLDAAQKNQHLGSDTW